MHFLAAWVLVERQATAESGGKAVGSDFATARAEKRGQPIKRTACNGGFRISGGLTLCDAKRGVGESLLAGRIDRHITASADGVELWHEVADQLAERKGGTASGLADQSLKH